MNAIPLGVGVGVGMGKGRRPSAIPPLLSTLKQTFRGVGVRGSGADPLAPLSAVERVERSWHAVSSNLEAAGVDFFTRIFLDVPDAMDLFLKTLSMTSEEVDALKRSQAAIRKFVKDNKMLKAHARLVIAETGRCVTGLYDAKTLVPRLRSLGRMHSAAGVIPAHYDIFFKHLLAVVRDRSVEAHGPRGWDAGTEEAWMTVKDSMARILSRPDDAGNGVDGDGSITPWGMACGLAGAYACLVAPLRVASVGAPNPLSWRDWTTAICDSPSTALWTLLDALLVAMFALELAAHLLLRRVKMADLRKVRAISSRKLQRASTFGKCIIVVRSLGIHETVTFPRSDFVYIISYVLQYWHQNTHNVQEECSGDATMMIGVHWTWALGLLRLVAALRALHALRCVEMVYTVNRRADGVTRTTMRVARLILSLSFTSHVVACLYVLVARIELGPEASFDTENQESLATTFFPDATILGNENGIMTNYLRCIHFAFTNLAGIGNHESVPRTALECAFTLVVNALGATLYAFTTGLLLSLIEPAAHRNEKFRESAAALTDFMTEVGITSDDQTQFMQGFILREMAETGGAKDHSEDDGPYAAAPGENATSPLFPEHIVHNLPRHLRDELRSIALVDAMRRRERAFRRCSKGFMTSLASSLKQSVILLPGDYLIREGQTTPSQLLIVEQGRLEVVVDGSFVHTFERGDMISFSWVDLSNNCFQLNKQPQDSGVYSPLLLGQSIAYASVRAMDNCKIATGLASKNDKKAIKKNYPSDWKELEFIIEISKGKGRAKSETDVIDGHSDRNNSGTGSIIVAKRNRSSGRKSIMVVKKKLSGIAHSVTRAE